MIVEASSTTAVRRSLAVLRQKRAVFLSKVSVLRLILNIDGSPILSKSYTHPSHSQTSFLLTSSLSLGVPVPRTTQCIRDM